MADVPRIFHSIAEKMRIDFNDLTSQIKHKGEKGKSRERILGDFLGKYLPAKVRIIVDGEIVSTGGAVSPQCDVIIADASTPPLYDEGGFAIVPIECVFAVIEVKSHLDTKELKDAHAKLKSIKQMEKGAFRKKKGPIRQFVQLHGRDWDFYPVLGFVFAYDSIALETLRQGLEELQAGSPLWHRVDQVWVLQKGFLASWDLAKDEYYDEPRPGTNLEVATSEHVLLVMILVLQHLYASAWMPEFRLGNYLGPDFVLGQRIDRGFPSTESPKN